MRVRFALLALCLLAGCGNDAERLDAGDLSSTSSPSSQRSAATSQPSTTSTSVAIVDSTTTSVAGEAATPSTASPEPPSTTPCGAPGTETDVADEPDYSADYLYRWTRIDGCDVRLDVLMTRRPPADFHCSGWPPDVVMGTPLGARTPETAPRLYVRDPEGYFGDAELQQGFAALDGPPASAVDTGYRQDGVALWMDPTDDRFIYLVAANGTERWPKETEPRGCA